MALGSGTSALVIVARSWSGGQDRLNYGDTCEGAMGQSDLYGCDRAFK